MLKRKRKSSVTDTKEIANTTELVSQNSRAKSIVGVKRNVDTTITRTVSGVLDSHGQGTQTITEKKRENVLETSEEARVEMHYREVVSQKRQRMTQSFLEKTPSAVLNENPILRVEAKEIQKQLLSYVSEYEGDKDGLLPDDMNVMLDRGYDTEASEQYIHAKAGWEYILRYYKGKISRSRTLQRIDRCLEKSMARALYEKALYMVSQGQDTSAVVWPTVDFGLELDGDDEIEVPTELVGTKFHNGSYKRYYRCVKSGTELSFPIETESVPKALRGFRFVVGFSQRFNYHVLRMFPECRERIKQITMHDLERQETHIPSLEGMKQYLAENSGIMGALP